MMRVESVCLSYNGQIFAIPMEEAQIRNGQKMYLAELAEGLLKKSLEQLIAANEKMRKLEKGRKEDAAQKEELTKQLQVVTEEKDFCGQRVADLSSQLEDSTDLSSFWKQMANTYATNLAEKTKELLESRKQFSSYRLESEQKLTTLKEFKSDLKKNQDGLAKKSMAMDRLEKETTATIQKLEKDNKWMRNVVSDLMKLASATNKKAQMTDPLEKESSVSMVENHFNCGNLLDLCDEEEASSAETFGKGQFNQTLNRCEIDDGKKGEENKESGMEEMEKTNIQMNDEASEMEDDESGEASSSSA